MLEGLQTQKRAYSHKRELDCGNHKNKMLQSDKDKNLRFVILYKLKDCDKQYSRLLEKLYMLELINKGYRLYNSQIINMGIENLLNSIAFECCCIFKTKENAENSLYKEIGLHTWSLLKNKYKN